MNLQIHLYIPDAATMGKPHYGTLRSTSGTVPNQP